MMRLLLCSLLMIAASAQAEELLMARSRDSFPETMLRLQASLKEHGYTLSRVQRVDIGLSESGFATDKYRVVFFGKPEEIRGLAAKQPRLIPYLPLQITVFEEGEETVVVAADPLILKQLAPDQETSHLLQRWNSDLHSIMDDVKGRDEGRGTRFEE